MKARDVMTRGVVSVAPDCTIKELAKRMQQYRISGLPVINAGGALVGMVTEADCQRRVEAGTEKKRSGDRFWHHQKPLPTNISTLMAERSVR
jgi:CBS domain-containing protein